jgi:hypothetical protein
LRDSPTFSHPAATPPFREPPTEDHMSAATPSWFAKLSWLSGAVTGVQDSVRDLVTALDTIDGEIAAIDAATVDVLRHPPPVVERLANLDRLIQSRRDAVLAIHGADIGTALGGGMNWTTAADAEVAPPTVPYVFPQLSPFDFASVCMPQGLKILKLGG